jgi:hypothetical protein
MMIVKMRAVAHENESMRAPGVTAFGGESVATRPVVAKPRAG